MIAIDAVRARLMLMASVQLMKLTLEELPVGTISVTNSGVIQTIDAWTESQLNFSVSSLRGSAITILFDEPAFDFLESLRKQHMGYVWRASLRTRTGNPLNSVMVLSEGIPNYLSHSVIYTAAP